MGEGQGRVRHFRRADERRGVEEAICPRGLMSDGERWAWQPQAGGAAEGAGGVVAPSLLARLLFGSEMNASGGCRALRSSEPLPNPTTPALTLASGVRR